MPLFTFGSNGSGQLGLGHTEDITIPERCLFDEATTAAAEGETEVGREEELGKDMDIMRIAAGGNHTLVLLRDGRVYAAGCNVDGRCGQHRQEEPSLLRFKRVIITTENGGICKTFKNVSATWEGTFLVASSLHNNNNNEEQKDVILALGSGLKGELGLGTTQPQTTTTPQKIPNFPPPNTKITSIASGMGHTAAVLSTGEVYGWGGARKGQLGEAAKMQKVVWEPVRVEGVPFFARGIACGREFTVVAGDEKGEYMVLGSCDDKWGIVSGGPGPISSGDDSGYGVLAPYANISAGWHAIYIHHHHHHHHEKNNSPITAWGRNDRGQLPPADLPNPRMLAVGSEHALALLDERTVVAFGWGEHGNCGAETDAQGNVKGRYNKIEVPGIEQGEIVGVGAGCATSWIVTS